VKKSILSFVLLCAIGAASGRAEEAVLDLGTSPSGFEAWISDRYVGRTPLLSPIPAGFQRLRLAAPSDSLFQPPALDTLLHAVAGETLKVRLALHAGPDRRRSVPALGLSPERPRARPLWRRLGRYAMPGLAAALAAGGIVAEEAADRSYSSYLRAAEPGEIRRLYRQTEDRDALSTALWVGAETALVCALLSWVLPERHDDGRRDAGNRLSPDSGAERDGRASPGAKGRGGQSR